MRDFLLLNTFLLPVFILSAIFLKKWLRSNKKNPPPSPPKLPIIGNLHQLGKSPHRFLHSLSLKYGDLMLLRLGTKPTLVVSSANAAREIMKTHDVTFSNRTQQIIPTQLLYNGKDVAFANYGEYWRQMKSICVLQLLSATRVRSFQSIREEETALMLENVSRSIPLAVNLTETLVMSANDVVCRAAFGIKLSGEVGVDLMRMLKKFLELMSEFAFGDYLPWLGWIDRLKGLDARIEKVAKELDVIFERILEEHVTENLSTGNDKVKDFVDVLLEVQRDETVGIPIDRDCIKALILDMFVAGTDTTSTLIEWAMSELLIHPKALKQVQTEVRRFAQGKQTVNEHELKNMEYLKAVIKETLRLHPPVPFLVSRESSEDVKICGYDIEARTQVMINAWAIQRDPSFWEDPNEFHPERFLNSTVDFKGQNFEFIPFGAGRRGCPGILFAITSAELVLANLLYAFDWALPDGVEAEKFDMTEGSGLIIRRRDPLLAVAVPYNTVIH